MSGQDLVLATSSARAASAASPPPERNTASHVNPGLLLASESRCDASANRSNAAFFGTP